MTKTKLNQIISNMVAEFGERIVIDFWDRDDNVSYRKVTFKEYVEAMEPCCRGDIEKLEGLLKKTVGGAMKIKGHFIHNTPEDIARRKEEARKSLALIGSMAGRYIGPYMDIMKRIGTI